MRNSENLWNDGLNFDNCQNNGQVSELHLYTFVLP